MDRKMELTIKDVTFHRNGISGRVFFSVRFAYTNEDTRESQSNMLAIMPEEPNEDNGTECYVIDLDNPTANWRGDRFAQDIKKAIQSR